MSSLETNIEDFIARSQQRLIDTIEKIGGLPPMYSVLAVEIIDGKEKYNDCLIPVPNNVLKNDETKDQMIEMIPFIIAQVMDTKMTPVCISWSSEAWIRKAPILKEGENIENTDWKLLPKTEAAIMFVETETRSEIIVFDMIRSGSKITPEGDMIDDITLTLNDELNSFNKENKQSVEGRFQNIFKDVAEAVKKNNS